MVNELDLVNESNLHEGTIDVLNSNENISSQRTSQYTQYDHLNRLREKEDEEGILGDNILFLKGSNEYNLYNKLKEEMGENRALEYFKAQRNLENNNNNCNEIIEVNIKENYASANQNYIKEIKEPLIMEN